MDSTHLHQLIKWWRWKQLKGHSNLTRCDRTKATQAHAECERLALCLLSFLDQFCLFKLITRWPWSAFSAVTPFLWPWWYHVSIMLMTVLETQILLPLLFFWCFSEADVCVTGCTVTLLVLHFFLLHAVKDWLSVLFSTWMSKNSFKD